MMPSLVLNIQMTNQQVKEHKNDSKEQRTISVFVFLSFGSPKGPLAPQVPLNEASLTAGAISAQKGRG